MATEHLFPCGCSWPVLEPSDDPGVLPLLDFDVERAPEDCPAVWDLLGRGLTRGIFQLESPLGKQWTRRLKPQSLEHLGALGALLRPGPLKAADDEGVSMTEHYVRRKNGQEEVEDFHPALQPILARTYGVLTYQEQSMAIARELAGFDLLAVDRLRKGIGKKDQKLIASIGDEFLAGCRKLGVLDDETAAKVWGWIKATGRYQFNASHSISYGIRGYKTAYVKTHFPLAFFTAWLRNARHKSDPREEINALVNDARVFGVAVEPPDLLSLERNVHTDRRVVKFGLADVKGVGESQVDRLVAAAPQAAQEAAKEFSRFSWWDYLVHLAPRVHAPTTARLVQAGAMRRLAPGVPRRRLLAEHEVLSSLTEKEFDWVRSRWAQFAGVEEALAALSQPRRTRASKGDGPFGGCSSEKRESAIRSALLLLREPPSPLVDGARWLAMTEEQLLGVALSCSLVDACDASAANATCREVRSGRRGAVLVCAEVVQVRQVKTKRGKSPGSTMAFLVLSDGDCPLDDVVCFPEAWAEFRGLLTAGNTVLLQGERDRNSDSFVVKKVWQASMACRKEEV